MKIENGKIVLKTKECICQEGKQAGLMKCPACKGTGRGKRGGLRGCKQCYGSRQVVDWNNPIPCTYCKGDYKNVPETMTDYISEQIWKSLSFKTVRANAPTTFNEEYVGIGYVYCCNDYGDAWNANKDEELIEEVKNHRGGIQACAIAKDDGTVCDYVAIIIKPTGYSVKAIFK